MFGKQLPLVIPSNLSSIEFQISLFSGVSYQEKRTNRRQRNQPTLITKKDYVQWEKTGLAPGGAYGVSKHLFFLISFKSISI
jgi:hypothetical protein